MRRTNLLHHYNSEYNLHQLRWQKLTIIYKFVRCCDDLIKPLLSLVGGPGSFGRLSD